MQVDLEEHQHPSETKRNLLIAIVIIAMIGGIIVLYLDYRDSENDKIIQEQELTRAYLELDSISNELDKRILTISKLGGKIDTLISIKDQLEAEKKLFLNTEKIRKLTIRDLKDKVEGYRQLLVIKDEEINQLTIINDKLISENNELKTESQVLNKSLNNIKTEKKDLEEKVTLLSRLKIEKFQVFAIDLKGKERSNEFRNRQIDQLKITFVLGENKVAPITGKKMWIRIVDPNSNVLFDLTKGSGTFMFDGRELFFTEKKEILYDRSQQTVIVYYQKGSEFPLGSYNVEIYTDDYVVGSGTFIVKN
ncbi:MAG: chromosome segregation protein SMC [Flammeovirgaceae bacterium]|nr:chromosome segregation protein SMC [Flammeovirgaceae bacterium]